MRKYLSFVLVFFALVFLKNNNAFADDSTAKTAPGDDNGKFYGQLVDSGVEVRKCILQYFVDYKKYLVEGKENRPVSYGKKFPWKYWPAYKKMDAAITRIAGNKEYPDYFLTYGAKIFRKLEEPEVKAFYGTQWSKEVEDAVLSHFEQDSLSDYSLDDFDAKKDAGLTETPLPLPKAQPLKPLVLYDSSTDPETMKARATLGISNPPDTSDGQENVPAQPTATPKPKDVIGDAAGDAAKKVFGF